MSDGGSIRPRVEMCNNEEDDEERGGRGIDEGAEDEETRAEEGEDVIVADENEERVARVARPPSEPSRLQREQHEISHLPPRDWCAHCRRGRGIRGAQW